MSSSSLPSWPNVSYILPFLSGEELLTTLPPSLLLSSKTFNAQKPSLIAPPPERDLSLVYLKLFSSHVPFPSFSVVVYIPLFPSFSPLTIALSPSA